MVIKNYCCLENEAGIQGKNTDTRELIVFHMQHSSVRENLYVLFDLLLSGTQSKTIIQIHVNKKGERSSSIVYRYISNPKEPSCK